MIRSLTDNAFRIRARADAAALRADRDPADVTIVAVSKTFPREDIDAAYEAGFRVFGESRVQEIREKCATPLPPDAHLHMIGSLQSNKIAALLPHIDVQETLDRPSLVDALARYLHKHESTLKVLLEINIGGEAQKAGMAPDDAASMLAAAEATGVLQPMGLMAMAPLGADDVTLRTVFGGLRDLRDRLEQGSGRALPILSMGMSNDFEIAIEEGATHVRIGRALFGER